MSLSFGDCNRTVEISISGYQFPKSDDRYDSNWLIVEVRHKENGKQKFLRDAALLSWELRKLRDCFMDRSIPETGINFLEPELSFGYDNSREQNFIRLRYGLAPDWDSSSGKNQEARYFFDLNDESRVCEHLKALNSLCDLFPVR